MSRLSQSANRDSVSVAVSGASIAHRVGLEIQARSSVSIRASIAQREGSLQQAIASDTRSSVSSGRASISSIRRSLADMSKTFVGRSTLTKTELTPLGNDRISENTEEVAVEFVESKSSSRASQSQTLKSQSQPQALDRAKNELKQMDAAKQVADIGAHKYAPSP